MDHKLLEIVLACKKWHFYLDSKKTFILIDDVLSGAFWHILLFIVTQN